MMHSFEGPLELMQQIQQHLAVGDELAAAFATTAVDPATGLLAGIVWDTRLGHLGIRASQEFADLDNHMPQLSLLFTPLFQLTTQYAVTAVTTAKDALIQARIGFIDAARAAITA